MEFEFRIKEVKAPFGEKEHSIFYPQINEEVEKTTGSLWWKKTTKSKEWQNFYRDYSISSSIFGGEVSKGVTFGTLWVGENNWSKVITCDNKEDCQKVFDEYKAQIARMVERWNIKYGEKASVMDAGVIIHTGSDMK